MLGYKPATRGYLGYVKEFFRSGKPLPETMLVPLAAEVERERAGLDCIERAIVGSQVAINKANPKRKPKKRKKRA